MEIGFDNEKYLSLERAEIINRVNKFNKKLYLEVGGKIFDDLHASRVLPGFKPDDKVKVLELLKDKIEVILCVSAKHIKEGKKRGDYGITYGEETIRIMKELRNRGIMVSSVVITLYEGEKEAELFKSKLVSMGENVYVHSVIKGYPEDLDYVVSDNGYGKNEFIKTTRPIVVVAGPGPCSGKLATCLTQLYHEFKNGVNAGYAKYETFPVWDLPLNHPVNIAYEAATADLFDENVIDPFHLKKYNIKAVNYNRDVEAFPVLNEILRRIMGESCYNSPTDMGINMIGKAICNDKVVWNAGVDEINRRYEKGKTDFAANENYEKIMARLKELNGSVMKK